MFDLELSNAAGYLRQRGVESASIAELGGGVSNTVLLVETPSERLVLKQALGKLRVEQDWFSDRSRVLRECDSILALRDRLPAGSVPRVLWTDPENYIFAMTAAPAGAEPWKCALLKGQGSTTTARTVGSILGAVMRTTWCDSALEQRFGDQTVFDQLRLDPYYRATAEHHCDLASFYSSLIADCQTRRVCVVHGDWSPKNLLVSGETVTAIDFEVVHYGNPAFDAAFLINHLLLKSFHVPLRAAHFEELSSAFWTALQAELPQEADWMEPATLRHLGGLLLARIDGKSPVEYLQHSARESVRRFARAVILDPCSNLSALWRRRSEWT